MTLEISVFIVAIVLGILMYWRESKNNGLYRFFNRLFNAKKLQMKATNKKGFLHQQSFIYRLIYIALLCLIVFGAIPVLTPLNSFSFELFTASLVGVLIGTYIASAIVFANKKIEDNKENITETIDKGKDFITDFSSDKETKEVDTVANEEKTTEAPEKSARERLKDKGLL